MKAFLDDNFLLGSETAVRLYRSYAADLPVIDYHCHINPKEIYEDLKYDNITQVWLYGDHYKWRAMRSCGVDEEYITGNASDYEKFCKYAETLEWAVGNPLYHWSHMELKKYFGYEGVLKRSTADEVWKLCNDVLRNEPLTVRKIIEKSNVEVICTTDDPVDSLEWHQKIREEGKLKTKVLPAWRPDRLINLEKKEFPDYIAGLAECSGVEITGLDTLKEAIVKRMDYFSENGCTVSDHGLDYVPYAPCTPEEADAVFRKALGKQKTDLLESEKYKTFILLFLAEEYSRRGWVMQLHYGCQRNINSKRFEQLGPDTGYDCISSYAPSEKLTMFLDAVHTRCGLPKTILYSLNPNDNTIIDSIIGGFQEGCAGKIQHGSAWWFNDNKTGMQQQMISLANLGVLGKFVGMLTDSRSFLSYTRHDYFRRILCDLIGGWVEAGEYPEDYEILSKIIKGISHDNAKEYFGFK
ncbi:MAG: glucuronate isomerase [Firmicutes bacterium]|nr:glucuronate isomerase [Bacillota bacterium]